MVKPGGRGILGHIRFWAGLGLLGFTAVEILGSLVESVDGQGPEWGGMFAVVLVIGIPGFVLAFPRQARRVPWDGSLVILAGVGIIIGGFAAWNSDRAFEQNSVETSAVLTNDATGACSSSARGGETCTWTAPLSYSVEGIEHSGIGGAPAQAVAGDVIPIRYLSDDPKAFRSDAGITAVGIDLGTGGDWAYWILPIIGLLVLAFGATLFGHKIWEQRQQGQPD